MKTIRGTFMAVGAGVALFTLAACGGGEQQQTQMQEETPAAQTETGGEMGGMATDTMAADTMKADTMKADGEMQQNDM
jgi:hypothetical protein